MGVRMKLGLSYLAMVLMIVFLGIYALVSMANMQAATNSVEINIHPHSGWFFIFGHSPISISRPQVGIMCLPACELLPATRKRVTRIKQT